jgi:glycolate oxidase iron-sulfur subunit
MRNLTKIQKFSLCNRCGKCVPVCPSYRVYKTEAFSPRGRLFLFSCEREHESFELCLFCERCQKICPHNIGFPELYLENLKKKKEKPISKEIIKAFSKDPLLTFLKLNNWLHFVNLRKESQTEILPTKGDITIYPSCGLKYFYPRALENFRKLVKNKGITGGIPEGLVCCGAIFLNLGLISLLKENAVKNLEVLEKEKGPILIFCATCLWMFKKIYPLIFKDTPYKERFNKLSEKVISAHSYLFSEFEEEVNILEKKTLSENVIFHIPCHLTEELSLVKNKLKAKDFCCGSAKLSLWLKGFQEKNKKEWIKNLENKDILATFCTGCYLNFSILLKKPPLIYHWMELL